MNSNKEPAEPAYTAVNNAKQSIAQSTALALADATDNLRNLNNLSSTAIGVALSQFIESGDAKYVDVIHEAQDVVTRGVENFGSVGEKIAVVLHDEES